MMKGVIFTHDDVVRELNHRIEEAGGLNEFCRIHDLDTGNVSNVAQGKIRLYRALSEVLGVVRTVVFVGVGDEEEE